VKLADYRADFYTFSGKASDLCRQLAFAGIALIWVFKVNGAAGPSLPPALYWPSALIVSALAFDMAHYVVASVIWRTFFRQKEREGVTENDESVSHSEWLEAPIWILFVIKILFVSSAYILLLSFLWTHIS